MLTAYAQLAAGMALSGANVAVAKLLAGALPIAMILGLRCLISSAVLLPLALWRDGARLPPRPVLANLFWQALFGTVLYNAALLLGLRLTTALEGGLVLATLPAVVAIGSALFLGERLALPPFLRDRDQPGSGWRTPDAGDVREGFTLTGYFLDQHVWRPRAQDAPEERARFVALGTGQSG